MATYARFVHPFVFGILFLVLFLGYASATTGSQLEKAFFSALLLFLLSATFFGLRLFLRHFKRSSVFVIHAILAAALSLLTLLHLADFFMGQEYLASSHAMARRVLLFQTLAVLFLYFPPLRTRAGAHSKEGLDRRQHLDLAVVYLFSAAYPTLHYVINNPREYTSLLIAQFFLIAGIFPAVMYAAMYVYARPFLSVRMYTIACLGGAVAIALYYLRPLVWHGSVFITRSSGLPVPGAVLHVVLLVLLVSLAVRFRSVVASFLMTILIILAGTAAYTRMGMSGAEPEEKAIQDVLTLERTPSVYFIVLDGYLNREGLNDKGLADMDIGPSLESQGWHVYRDAYSNYNTTIQSMSSFFATEHYYDDSPDEWELLMTGDNTVYRTLKANGYTTAIVHQSDYLLRAHCNADICAPAPSIFGEIGFILAETIFFEKEFIARTQIGRGSFRARLYDVFERSDRPLVVYSHLGYPGHGPSGCADEQPAIDRYARRLRQANEWFVDVIQKIENTDDRAIIIVFGDHGARIAGHCDWQNPDVTARSVIVDNVGILLAVKWPADYDGRYDDAIHSPIDLSWCLLQYLSDEAQDPRSKPESATYIASRRVVYKVVDNGEVLLDAERLGERERAIR